MGLLTIRAGPSIHFQARPEGDRQWNGLPLLCFRRSPLFVSFRGRGADPAATPPPGIDPEQVQLAAGDVEGRSNRGDRSSD